MKKLAVIGAMLILIASSCTSYRTCPTYANGDLMESATTEEPAVVG